MAVAVTEGAMRPMTELRVTAHVNSALRRALEMGLYARVVRLTDFQYEVQSVTTGGLKYAVWLGFNDENVKVPQDCDCEAGQHLPYCLHRAAVQISMWVEEGYEVELAKDGRVYRTKREVAAPLAFDPLSYEALIQDTPPLTEYEQHPEPLEPAPIRHPRFEVLNDD